MFVTRDFFFKKKKMLLTCMQAPFEIEHLGLSDPAGKEEERKEKKRKRLLYVGLWVEILQLNFLWRVPSLRKNDSNTIKGMMGSPASVALIVTGTAFNALLIPKRKNESNDRQSKCEHFLFVCFEEKRALAQMDV